jgi:hypothetical protein
MLTASGLRAILDAAIGQECGGYVDALVQRGMLPSDDTPLTARAVVIVLLAIISGESPAKAVFEALRIAEFRLSGTTQRRDAPGGAAMVWENLPQFGETIVDALVGIIETVGAGTLSAALPPIVQLRRVKPPAVDVVLIEALQRIEGVLTLSGLSFAPPSPQPAARRPVAQMPMPSYPASLAPGGVFRRAVQ